MNRLISIVGCISIFSGYWANFGVQGNAMDAKTEVSNIVNPPLETTGVTLVSTTSFVVAWFPAENFTEIQSELDLQLSDHNQCEDVNNVTKMVEEKVDHDENEVNNEIHLQVHVDAAKSIQQIISVDNNAQNSETNITPFIFAGFTKTIAIICFRRFPTAYL